VLRDALPFKGFALARDLGGGQGGQRRGVLRWRATRKKTIRIRVLGQTPAKSDFRQGKGGSKNSTAVRRINLCLEKGLVRRASQCARDGKKLALSTQISACGGVGDATSPATHLRDKKR